MITSLILLSFAVLIYLTLYFFLPTFYEQYKTNQLQSGITEIIDKSKNLTLKEAKELLDEYSLENNAIIYLQEKNGHILYSPSFNFQGNTQSPTITGKASSPTQNEDTVNAFNQSLPIQFLNGHHLIVTVFATFQPIDEASQVLVRFLPYISIIVVCISLGSA